MKVQSLALVLVIYVSHHVHLIHGQEVPSEWYCGSDPCIFNFDVPCPTVVETYEFYGQCCSLSDDTTTENCVLTVSAGSCAFYEKGTVTDATSSVSDGSTCAELPEGFQFPGIVDLPPGLELPDGTPIADIVNRTQETTDAMTTSSSSSSSSGILGSVVGTVQGTLETVGNVLDSNVPGVANATNNVVNVTTGDVLNIVGNVLPEEIPGTNITIPDGVPSLPFGLSLSDVANMLEGMGDSVPTIPCFPILNLDGVNVNAFVRVSVSEEMCPAPSYNVVPVPEMVHSQANTGAEEKEEDGGTEEGSGTEEDGGTEEGDDAEADTDTETTASSDPESSSSFSSISSCSVLSRMIHIAMFVTIAYHYDYY